MHQIEQGSWWILNSSESDLFWGTYGNAIQRQGRDFTDPIVDMMDRLEYEKLIFFDEDHVKRDRASIRCKMFTPCESAHHTLFAYSTSLPFEILRVAESS